MKLQLFRLSFLYFFTFNIVQAQNSAKDVLNEMNLLQDFQSAGISVLAVNLKTGEKVLENQPYLGLAPASTVKLFTTGAALEILGPEYRPETRIYSDGIIRDSILYGNIWIRGGGDMSLGSRFFNDKDKLKDFLISWTDSLKKKGINRIQGSVIADGSDFGYSGVPDGWAWSDMGNYYGSGPSGMALFDNSIVYTFKTGSSEGSPTVLSKTFPEVPGLVFHNFIRSENVNDDNSYIYGSPYSSDRFGTGSLPMNKNQFAVRGSLPDPEFQMAIELTEALQMGGIKVDQDPKAVRKDKLYLNERYGRDFHLLFSWKGQKISDIVRLTNMRSINHFAEQLVCLIAYKKYGNGSYDKGIKEIERYWSQKINATGLFLKDGSGLSRTNGISAYHFCELLKYMETSSVKDIFFASLPVAGKSGTLSNLCKNQAAEGKINAKSGTMARIKSYSGYITTVTGKRLAFAIIISNFSGSSANTTTYIEKILNKLVLL
jgi:D-alanyl-D-alanine carboxypeptidase/D-alanyl-D-alanine-endopeptidase (penicillin-binding protein 4)